MKKLLLLGFIAFCHLVAPAAEQIDGPHIYRDENSVRDKRNIAILTYDSLVHNTAPNDGRPALKIASPFTSTSISLPVGMSRQSSRGTNIKRVTAVIDNTLGSDRPVYATKSFYNFLPNARNNLAAREGAFYRAEKNEYELKDIFYMKKRLPVSGRLDSNEKLVPGTRDWVIRTHAQDAQLDPRVLLPDHTAKAFAAWADQSGYSAIIWASLPPTYDSISDVAKDLQDDSTLMRNTQEYINVMPGGEAVRTPFEKDIIIGDVSGFIQ